MQGREPAPGPHAGIGQIDAHAVVVAHPPFRGIQRRPCPRLLARRLDAQPAGRLLRGALPRPCDDPRHALLREGLAPDRGAGRQHLLLMDAVPLLSSHHLARRRLGLAGGRLLGVQRFAPLRVGAAEGRQCAAVQLGGVVHEVEQRRVVADHDERAAPAAHELVDPFTGVAIEVVGGFIEQRDRCRAQPHSDERGEHRFAAGELTDATVQDAGWQAGLVERRRGARLDVPLVADGVEEMRRGVARRDRAHGVERRGHAENIRDATVGSERQSLRQQIDGAGRRNRPGCRRESARDESEQRRLAGSVASDEAGAARAERAGDVVQRRRAVRPGEGHAVDGDRGGGGVSGGHGVLPNRESADAADTGASAMRADVHGHAPGGGGRSTVGAEGCADTPMIRSESAEGRRSARGHCAASIRFNGSSSHSGRLPAHCNATG